MKKRKTPGMAAQDTTVNVETKELRSITRAILTKTKAEKIICFGSTIKNVQHNSCFIQEKPQITLKQNSYYLLVIPAVNELTTDIILQQKLEEAVKEIASVTIIVHRMEEINMALQNGSSFFSAIYKNGKLLHDNDVEPFIVPTIGIAISKRISKREKFWDQWYLLSDNFLQGANFYYEKQLNNLAVFMLHQSLQHCYSGMLKVLTGYRSNSNSLKRLLKLIDNILPESSFSPDQHTPENARLLGLLLKGFGDARYSDKFEVTNAELNILITRIENILKQANTACLNHLNNLKLGKTPYIA
ncbi:HEPN domain-containing protein [Pedobacter nyackensis]|uniref:HEPN domain-containing protein n=1 Tax=Pedobacter nyackensis TaxID=475255 RepID=UPI002931BD92|nr:HEPN domain-containing protein [Pedobacter nyackensis]